VKRWYQRRPVQAGIAAGIVAAIVGGVLWATRYPSTFWPQGNITIDRPTLGRP
jgi:hypothetical protein